ncbi:glycosyltransferase family 2 protein [soil metagenome]
MNTASAWYNRLYKTMTHSAGSLISFVIPVYNESENLPVFHSELLEVVASACESFEILYCDDGSSDNTKKLVGSWHEVDSRIRLVCLSRNFGKESALAAGIEQAAGQAIVMLDGDGQHPVESVPKFLNAWERGFKVVVGISKPYRREGLFKRLGSKIFYATFNRLTVQKIIPGSSDFRLIDHEVRDAFLGFKETDRITRGLLDWIGFERAYIPYTTKVRSSGGAGYSNRKLIGLAANSFVSSTPTPLYIFGYLGVGITIFSLISGLSVLLEQLILGDPLGWRFTGTAMLGILLIFMVGIVLMSQGILSLYISHINNQSKQRPLYIIDKGSSRGLHEQTAK